MSHSSVGNGHDYCLRWKQGILVLLGLYNIDILGTVRKQKRNYAYNSSKYFSITRSY